MDHCIPLVQHLFTHVHFITNGYTRFSKTNSTFKNYVVVVVVVLVVVVCLQLLLLLFRF